MSLERARELRKNATHCERLLWSHLRAGRFKGFKFKRQQPLGRYIVDFVCFETSLIIEADGSQHIDQAEYDAHRDNWLASQGFKVLRFWNNEILMNIEGVLATILQACLDAPSRERVRGDEATEAIKDIEHSSPLHLWERGRGRGGEGL